uniref:G_PROTEIN_RECEP_F1_2 domain-containing protein n=1 Tax=Haemonchus contortus TaxID=6289 RepID=A0A7I4Y6I0_HAECO
MSLPVIAQQEKLDYIFSTIYSVYTLMGALLNGFLLSLIILHKQQDIQRYRILLGNTTCTLLLLSILVFFLQPRFVMATDSMAYVSLGPARFINSPIFNLFATAFMFVFDIYSFMTLAMCMVYKYITLARTSPSVERIFGVIGLLFLLPLSSGAALIIYSPNFTKLYATMEAGHPEYNLSRYGKYCGLPDVKNYYVVYFFVVVCSIGVLSYVIMIITGLKIRRYVLSVHSNMSKKTSRTFNMMIKALVIQSCMPIFFSFPTKALYFLMQFGSFESLIGEYLVFFMSPIIVVVDPCVTMYYVLPYRSYILKKLRLDRNKQFAHTVSVQPTLSART